MKKTLVALAVLAAGSAQAIELYNQDKLSVDLSGDIEVVYMQGTAKDSEFKQSVQDADFGFDVRYAVNDDLEFGGYWEFSGEADDSAGSGDIYVGFYSKKAGDFKFGKTVTQLDDAGIGSDYQFGITSFFQNGSPFSGEGVAKYNFDNGNFYAGAAYLEGKSTNALGADGSFVDGVIGGRLVDGTLDIRAFLGNAEFDTKATGDIDSESILALEASYSGVENLGLAVGYYSVDADKRGQAAVNPVTLAFAIDYNFDIVKVAAGFSTTDADVGTDQSDWYVNVGHDFVPGATVYGELGGNDLDDSETGIAIGVKAAF